LEGVRFALIGLIIGVIFGLAQFWLLSKFTSTVSRGEFDKKTALFAVFQFLLPVAVLVPCAFLLPNGLLWSGVGMASTLIVCAIVRFLITLKSGR